MFFHRKEEIVIITDTLATREDGTALLLMSKIYIVPHLGIIISSTGIASVGQQWITDVYSRILCRDIDALADLAPSRLRLIQDDIANQFELASSFSSTIYHFGYSDKYQQYVRYVFRSEKNYEPELHLEPSFGVKPGPRGAFKEPETLPDIISLAENIRKEQQEFPTHERVHIGGELSIAVMKEKTITCAKIHKFPDFEQQWRQMIVAIG